MTLEMAIKTMRELNPGDPEAAHSGADNILLSFLQTAGYGELVDEYMALVGRCEWWACA